jgi:hypothetical protein
LELLAWNWKLELGYIGCDISYRAISAGGMGHVWAWAPLVESEVLFQLLLLCAVYVKKKNLLEARGFV